MEKFRAAAKLTHSMYGTSNPPARFEILRKLRMVNSIANQRATITIKPNRGDLNPKKAIDQSILNKSWTQKMTKAILTPGKSKPLRQTKNADSPIIMNSVIQTGENSQLGGVKDGFLKVAYQMGMEGVVKIEPMIPANWQTIMLITSLIISLDLIHLSLFP